jgi:hypothetical protein
MTVLNADISRTIYLPYLSSLSPFLPQQHRTTLPGLALRGNPHAGRLDECNRYCVSWLRRPASHWAGRRNPRTALRCLVETIEAEWVGD